MERIEGGMKMEARTSIAWIPTVDESEATGRVKEIYDKALTRRSYIGNIVKAHSIKPELMHAYQEFSHSVTFGGTSLGGDGRRPGFRPSQVSLLNDLSRRVSL